MRVKKGRRIALVLPRLGGGGVPRVRIGLAAAFLRRGLTVDIVAFRAEGPMCDHVPAGAEVVDLAAGNVWSAIGPLRRYLREKRPDAVISAMEGPNLVSVIARACTRGRPCLAVGTHNTLSVVLKERMSARTQLWMPWALKFAYQRADVVFAVSCAAGADLVNTTGLPAERIRVFYNPVVTPVLSKLAAEAPEHPWMEDGGPSVILAAGRLTKQKGFSTLLRAFALLRQQRPARLLILGEGPARAELEPLARDLGVEDAVDMPGFVHNPFAYMAHARLFVLSSAWEGLPAVLIEALACGCPVVATDCPSGPREILVDGKFGRLVPVGDASALAEAMRATLCSPTDPALLKARAMDFHVDRIVDQYCEALGILREGA